MLGTSDRPRGIYLSAFPAMLAYGMLRPWIPVYAVHLGSDFVTIGAIGAAASVPQILGFIFGSLSDRLGRRPLFYLGVLFGILTSLLLVFSRNALHIIPVASVFGLGGILLIVTAEVMATDLANSKRTLEAIGRVNFASALAAGIGPVMAAIIVERYDFTILFLSTLTVAGISVLISPFNLPKSRMERSTHVRVPNPKFWLGQIWPLTMTALVFGATSSLILQIFPAYALTVGIRELSLGLLITVFGFVRALTLWSTGYLSEIGEWKMIVSGMAIMSLTVTLVGFVREFIPLLALLVFLGIGMGFVLPSVIALAPKISTLKMKGEVIGTMESMLGIGGVVGAFLAGVVAETLGMPIVHVFVGSSAALMSLAVGFRMKYLSREPKVF